MRKYRLWKIYTYKSRVCPWALFIVIAKLRRIENWVLQNGNGYIFFNWYKWNFRYKNSFTRIISCCYFWINSIGWKFWQINWVSLHNLSEALRLWSKITGQFGFKTNSRRGIPFAIKVFKKSSWKYCSVVSKVSSKL